MYKEASRIDLRVLTKRGPLTVGQLWELPIEELDTLAVSLQEVHEASGKKSFLVSKSVKDKKAKLQFDIVLDILNTKVEEARVLSEAKEIKEHNSKILSLIAEKTDDALKGKSVKQLEAMLK